MTKPLLLALLFLLGVPAHAQMSNMPKELQSKMAEIGPVWGKDIAGNIAITQQHYMPLLEKAPHGGVTVTRDLSYGPDARHRLDIFRPDGGRKNMPIVVFLHGGAYVRGERDVTAEIYGNVSLFFARNRMLGVNATYRLAPAATWPAAAEDVGALVKWLKANAITYGGDPRRIFLIGHSAGATHVATYAYLGRLQPKEGAGVAGIVLMSGRYHFDPKPDDPNLRNFQAYFGTDATRYAAMSPINHIDRARKLPTFIVIAEHDNPDLDTQGAMLFSALCQRERACPRFTRMEHHNHLSMVYQFNTTDRLMGREIIEFIRRGK